MKISHRITLLLSLLALLTGCGYHSEDPNQFSANYQTLAVPYIVGDQEGLLTDELIKAIALSGQFTYSENGELILEGKIKTDQTTHIGWQYDRDPITAKRINRLIPNEGRREVSVEFSLISARTGKCIYGPTEIKADSTYDFIDPDSPLDISFLNSAKERQSVLFFSLGQLDSSEGAQNAALAPLYRKLAYKIIYGIENIPFHLE